MVALAFVLVYPLGYNLWLSFHVSRLSVNDGAFAGWQNYVQIVSAGDLAGTIGRTFVFTFGSMALHFVIGLAAALALENLPRAARVLQPLLLIPWVMPSVAVASIWIAILNPIYGLANRILDIFSIAPVHWLEKPIWAMTSLIVVNTWKSSAYWILMLSAGLKSIPAALVESARVDGARYCQVLWHVLLPGLRPILATTSLLSFIWAFNYFDLVYLLTNGGPGDSTTTLPFAIWEYSFKFNRYDRGAAYSVLSVLTTGLAIFFYLRINSKNRFGS